MALFVLRPFEGPLLDTANNDPSNPISGTQALAVWNWLERADIGLTGAVFAIAVAFLVAAAGIRFALQQRKANAEFFDFDGDARETMIAFYHAKAEPAFEAAYHLLGRVTFRLMDRPGAERYVGQLIDDFLRDEARETAVTLDKTCRGERELAQDNTALQALLGRHYEKYQLMSMWVEHGYKLLNFPLPEDREYKLWQTLDSEYLRALKELISRTRFEQLRGRVTDIGWGESFRPASLAPSDQQSRQYRVVS
jgi:hypothetical protein